MGANANRIIYLGFGYGSDASVKLCDELHRAG